MICRNKWRQIQVNGNLIIQNGLDFKEVFSIFDTLKTACVELAVSQAKKRVKTFEDKLRDRIEKLEERVKVLESFADPAFQVSLMNAQKSAACSENGISIDILAELIISRVFSLYRRSIEVLFEDLTHIILWICDRGSAQDHERVKSGASSSRLLDLHTRASS